MEEGMLAARGRARSGVRAAAVVATALAVLAVVGAALWLTVLPGMIMNLTAHVAVADETATVGAATVPVPAGWAVQRPPFQDVLVLLSPDRVLAVTVTAPELTPDAAFEAAVPDTADAVTEALGSGLQAVHAEVGADRLAAAVGRAGDSPSAVLVARATTGAASAYAYAFAELLDATAVAP